MANQNYKEAWQFAMNKLHEEYKANNNEDEFVIWYKMEYIEDTIDTIDVAVPSTFVCNVIKTRGYLDKVQNTLREILGHNTLVLNTIVSSEKVAKNEGDFGIKDTENPGQKTEIPVEEPKSITSNEPNFEYEPEEEEVSTFKKHPLLQEEFTFDTFIPGENSNFAYNAALAVSKNPGKQYNPILLYGSSGLGKTHLMQAIGNYINNHSDRPLKICYVSAESFTNEFILSTREKKTDAFKNKYRGLDVLLLDDIHFLQNKDATQEELFYTFNALSDKKAQMVFTCDRPIKEIKNLKARLVSRLANGLCIDVKTPNYETRCAILQKKAEQMNQVIEYDVIDYIAKNVETNVRELEAALKQVIAYAELINERPSLEIARNQLKDIFAPGDTDNISLETIQIVVAENYGISLSEIKSKKRDKKYSLPRQISFYIAREITEASYKEIAEAFSKKDHTTVIHGYNTIADQIKIDPNLDAKIKLFIKEIKEYKKK